MTSELPRPAYNDMVVGPDAPIMMRYKRKKFLTAAELAAREAKYAAGQLAAKQAAARGGAGANGEGQRRSTRRPVHSVRAAPLTRPHRACAAAATGEGGVEPGGLGGVQLTRAVADANFPNGPMLVLWGSQTGTAESFGKLLVSEARQRGYDAISMDLEEYAPHAPPVHAHTRTGMGVRTRPRPLMRACVRGLRNAHTSAAGTRRTSSPRRTSSRSSS